MLIHARIHAPLPSLSEGCGKIQNSKIDEGVRIRNRISQELKKKKTYLEIKNVEMLVVWNVRIKISKRVKKTTSKFFLLS